MPGKRTPGKAWSYWASRKWQTRFVIEIDLGDLVGLSLGGAKLTEHKKDESGIMRYTFTCTVKGNDLPFGLDMKMPDDKDPKGKMYHFPEAGVWHRVQ